METTETETDDRGEKTPLFNMRTREQNQKYRELRKKGYDSKTAYILSSDNPWETYQRIEKFVEEINRYLSKS